MICDTYHITSVSERSVAQSFNCTSSTPLSLNNESIIIDIEIRVTFANNKNKYIIPHHRYTNIYVETKSIGAAGTLRTI